MPSKSCIVLAVIRCISLLLHLILTETRVAIHSVALSCTADLSSDGHAKYLGEDYTRMAWEKYVPNLPRGRASYLTGPLLAVLHKDGVEGLRNEVIRRKAAYEESGVKDQELRNILCVLEHL